jgi:broad specificity phosphatase PhoE
MTIRALARIALSLGIASVATIAGGEGSVADTALVEALRGGGCVIVIRHGATNPDQADTDPLNVGRPGNEAKQRLLSDKGRAAARAWNEAFRTIGIPVGKVYSSKFYRAVETARLAFGEPTTTLDVSEGGLVVSPNENERRRTALRKLVTVAPATGRNTVIVSHAPNIIDAFGKDWLDGPCPATTGWTTKQPPLRLKFVAATRLKSGIVVLHYRRR